MKKMSIFLCFSFLLLPFAGCSDSDNGTGESSGGDGVSLEDIRVIPLPQFISYGRGAFAVDKDVTISCTAAIEDEATLLAGYLKERGIDTVFIVGIATDFCVAWTAIDACKFGFKAYVISDATKGIDLNGSLQHAWQEMLAKGVKRILVKDIIQQ